MLGEGSSEAVLREPHCSFSQEKDASSGAHGPHLGSRALGAHSFPLYTAMQKVAQRQSEVSEPPLNSAVGQEK